MLCCIRLKIKVLIDSNIKKCAGEKADVFVKYMSCVVFSEQTVVAGFRDNYFNKPS